MPVTTTIYRSTTSVGALFFDGTIDEDHDYETRLTNNPLEFGANAVDHAIVTPNIVTLNIIVGDVWTGLNQATTYNPFQRSADCLSQLRQLQIDREPLIVVCNLARYDKMLLRSVKANQGKSTSSTLVATLVFQEAIFIDDQQQDLPVNNNNNQYQTPKNSGNKQLQPEAS